jgi:hypothetical protein
MNITFNLTENQVQEVMNQSISFRTYIVAALAKAQAEISSTQNNWPYEGTLLESLRAQVKSNVRYDNKIQWIKNVRQWAMDNKLVITPNLYNQLYSLKGAKDFVEGIMGIPRY